MATTSKLNKEEWFLKEIKAGTMSYKAYTTLLLLFHYVSLEHVSAITCGRNQAAHMYFFFNGSTAPWGVGHPIFRGFTITLFRHTTLGKTPLDEGPARRRDLNLTTHNTHNRQTSMP